MFDLNHYNIFNLTYIGKKKRISRMSATKAPIKKRMAKNEIWITSCEAFYFLIIQYIYNFRYLLWKWSWNVLKFKALIEVIIKIYS